MWLLRAVDLEVLYGNQLLSLYLIYLEQKILQLLPEKINNRWQFHSIGKNNLQNTSNLQNIRRTVNDNVDLYSNMFAFSLLYNCNMC